YYLYGYFPGPAGSRLGNRKIGDVYSPSSKVLLHDEHDRHFGKRMLHYGIPTARQPLLCFDGSVNIRKTIDCNKGGDPNALNGNGAPVQINYFPGGVRPWDPDPLNPTGDMVFTYYRFTRGGLRGVDFGGGEV